MVTVGGRHTMTDAPVALKAHKWPRDPNDWYVEPAWCSARLFDVEKFGPVIYDPACGIGTIVMSAKVAGMRARGSDYIARWSSQQDHVYWRRDFLEPALVDKDDACIVSNPPFKCARRFVERALETAAPKIAFLLPLSWLTGATRSKWLQTTPLAHVWVLTPRPSMPPGTQSVIFEEPVGGGEVDFAWFVWRRDHAGPPTLGWLDRDGP